MNPDYNALKTRLKDFLTLRGIEIGKGNVLRCPNPSHADETPSAIYYSKGKKSSNPVVWCPVCMKSWSIFGVAALLDNITDDTAHFPEMLKSVQNTLGISSTENEYKNPSDISIPVSLDEARKIYTENAVNRIGSKWGKIKGSWPYHNSDGQVIALDVRFENNVKKTVFTFWYNGKSLKTVNPPVLIYNLPEVIKSEKPILIVEGCKCAEIARQLTEFTPCTWSGGAAKAHIVDWSPLRGKEIFILPDNDKPGLKAARSIQRALPQAKIIKPLTEGEGDDIEQFLEVLEPDRITEYVLNPDNIEAINEELPESPDDKGLPPGSSTSGDSSSIPFKILGIGEDGRANFVTPEGRLVSWPVESFSKEKFRVLADKWWWFNNYEHGGKMVWENALEDITRLSVQLDFDDANLRGRGAWRDEDKISYHDGINTYGDYSPKKIYMRRPQRDIGLTDPPLDNDTIGKIREIILRLSFQTPTDAVRCMSWSVLAPFCGALPFRPAILLTGPSGSGKTTVATLMINKLADALWLNGSETTVAGIRGRVKKDSRPIVFDETEGDTEKKKINREELLSLMRANTSDDTPDTSKGTKDGGYVSYKMASIFGFVGIDPTIEREADENRIFRINMVKSKTQEDWRQLDKDIHKLLTDKNCRAIRSLTWTKLKTIFTLSENLVDPVRDKTGRDFRSSLADSLLLATFFVIWNGVDEPSENQIDETLNKYYSYQPAERHREDAEEIIDRILDEVIEILHNSTREKLTIIEILTRVYTGTIENPDGSFEDIGAKEKSYRRFLEMYGIKLLNSGLVFFMNNNHLIKKITGLGAGYGKLLQRHAGKVNYEKPVTFQGKSKRGIVIDGLIVKRYEDKTEFEKLKDVF